MVGATDLMGVPTPDPKPRSLLYYVHHLVSEQLTILGAHFDAHLTGFGGGVLEIERLPQY